MFRPLSNPVVLGTIIAVGLGGVACAAKKPEAGRSALVQTLSDCRNLKDDSFRLACYDKAAASLDEAEQQGQVVVVDREQVKAVRRQAFGFSLPAFDIFGRGVKEEKIDRISETVESAHLNSEGRWVMMMTDGASWIEKEAEHDQNPPAKGSIIKIRSGTLGSFFCNVDGQYAVRCERQR